MPVAQHEPVGYCETRGAEGALARQVLGRVDVDQTGELGIDRPQGRQEPGQVHREPDRGVRIDAVQRLMKSMGVTIDHFDLIEANEAFAAQACAVNKGLGWDTDKVNVNGGAIAIGHPIGASGARILVTLIGALRKQGKKRGVASLCIGGGEATAMAIELL